MHPVRLGHHFIAPFEPIRKRQIVGGIRRKVDHVVKPFRDVLPAVVRLQLPVDEQEEAVIPVRIETVGAMDLDPTLAGRNEDVTRQVR